MKDAPCKSRFARRDLRSGQAILESCIVVVLMSLLLFGLLEVARLFMGREVLTYAATVGARAHSVGFNDFMIYKTVRVAGIPIAGQMLTPKMTLADPNAGRWQANKPGDNWDFAVKSNPGSLQYDSVEQSRIPLYLGAKSEAELSPVLNYADWEHQTFASLDQGETAVDTKVKQDVLLKFAFHRTFWGADDVQESGEAAMDSHYQFYLQPQ